MGQLSMASKQLVDENSWQRIPKTDDSLHPRLTNTLIQKVSYVGWQVDMELDIALTAYQSAFKNDGNVFGAIFSQILEQRARIRDLMHENERLADEVDSEMG